MRLEVATRQFDLALASYESLLRGDGTTPVRADLQGLLTDYLVLVIRVEDDLPVVVYAQCAQSVILNSMSHGTTMYVGVSSGRRSRRTPSATPA